MVSETSRPRGPVVVLTGAGISADSGVATFRDSDGLWEGHRVEDVATPEAFQRNPALVHSFYDARRAQLDCVVPNPAHSALVELERHWGEDFLLITQNVDDLHERAGSRRLLHMHGELRRARCLACGQGFSWDGGMGEQATCPRCGSDGRLRPDIVWFGEMPHGMAEIGRALRDSRYFISIGTSGAVYPAAGFVETARSAGARCIELNLEPSQGSICFHETRLGRASEIVPAFVEEMLAG